MKGKWCRGGVSQYGVIGILDIMRGPRAGIAPPSSAFDAMDFPWTELQECTAPAGRIGYYSWFVVL